MNEIITPGFHEGNPDSVPEAIPLLVLGVGNTLLTDDGVGPKVVETLKSRNLSDTSVEYLDGGTLSFTLLDDIKRCNALIVVDACELDAVPGTIRVFEGLDMDEHMRSGKRSVHEVALADLFDMARLQDCLPDQRALIGVQPDDLTWGLELSASVARSLDEACNHVDRLINGWRP